MNGSLIAALQTIADFPCAAQDNMPAANMRKIARDALDSFRQHHEQAEGAQGERKAAITKFAETCPMTAESAAGGKSYDIELRRYYLLGWDDRAALAQPSPVPELDLPERGTQHRFSTTEQTCRHDFAGVWWSDNGVVKTGCECRHCGFFVADITEAAELDVQPYRHHAEKIRRLADQAATEYEAGRSALGYMEDIAESALALSSGLDRMSAQHDRIVGALQHQVSLLALGADQAMAERDAAQARVAELERQLTEECGAHSTTIEQRDSAEQWADDLAQAIGEKFGVEIGEHSSLNCPWEEALNWIQADDAHHAPVAQAGQAPQAWLDVQAERRRQVADEGWTPEHDNEHDHGQMARAAACYALAGSSAADDKTTALLVSLAWPWDQQWWKPTTARRDLVKACALALAEIERLDRAAAPQPAGGE